MRVLRPYEELLDTHPLLRLALPLILGIVFGEWGRNFLGNYVYAFWGLMVFSLAVAICISISRGPHQRKSIPFLLSISCTMIFLGTSLQLMAVKSLEVEWDDVQKIYRGVIVDTPKEKDKVWQTTVQIEGGNADGKLVRVALMKSDALIDLRPAVDSSAVVHNVPVSVASSFPFPVSASATVSPFASTPISVSVPISEYKSAVTYPSVPATASKSSQVLVSCLVSDSKFAVASVPDPASFSAKTLLSASNFKTPAKSVSDTSRVDNKSEDKVASDTSSDSSNGSCEQVASRFVSAISSSPSGKVKAPVGSSNSQKLMTGDVLLFHTRIRAPHNAGNPSEFDFAQWLRHQGISGSAFCFASQWRKSACQADDLSLKIRVLRWRDALVEKYKAYFGGRDLAVLAAMTLGDKTHLDASTRDVFSQTGVSHVLALSGFHLSVLFSIYQLLVLSLCRQRKLYTLMSIFGICGLWIFALLAGLPLSLVRAAVMFSIVQMVSCFAHDAFSVNNLSLAAILLLIVSPQSLFDVGFQLSFLSVFFIILFSKSFPRPTILARVPMLGWCYDLFVVSLCAQLGTAPLVAYYFHTFPVYGWLSNFVAVPLAYIILGVGLLFFALPFARGILVVILGGSLRMMDTALTALSQLPGAVLELYPTLLTVVLFYLLFYCAVSYLLHRRGWKLFRVIALMMAIFCVEFYEHRPHRLSPQLLFYNVRSVPVVHALVSAEQSYVWTTRESKADSVLASVKKTFWKKEKIRTPLWMTEKTQNDDIYCDGHLLVFNGLRVALLTTRPPKGKPEHPLSVDYLLLARGVRGSLDDILACYAPHCVVLDASLTDFYRKQYLKEMKGRNIRLHDMDTQGALQICF